MPRPTDVRGVQRLFGVVTYLQVSATAQHCLQTPPSSDKQATVFDWLPQHEEAFIKIKELITQAPVLCYFDVNKAATIECDSSKLA